MLSLNIQFYLAVYIEFYFWVWIIEKRGDEDNEYCLL